MNISDVMGPACSLWREHVDVVAVPWEVVNGAELLAAHGLRLIDQMSVEVAVMKAAIARIAAASRVSMAASESGSHLCSPVVPCRKMFFQIAGLDAWQYVE
jgi:hypothetical protein